MFMDLELLEICKKKEWLIYTKVSNSKGKGLSFKQHAPDAAALCTEVSAPELVHQTELKVNPCCWNSPLASIVPSVSVPLTILSNKDLFLFNPTCRPMDHGQGVFGGSLAFFRAAPVLQVILEEIKLFPSAVLLDHNGGLSLRSVAFLRVETTRCCWRPPFCGRETNTTCAANKRPVDLTTS